jgi:hypothetical protein
VTGTTSKLGNRCSRSRVLVDRSRKRPTTPSTGPRSELGDKRERQWQEHEIESQMKTMTPTRTDIFTALLRGDIFTVLRHRRTERLTGFSIAAEFIDWNA